MRLPRRSLVVSLVIAVAAAAGLFVFWRAHSPSRASGSTVSGTSAGRQFFFSGISTKSSTPYRLAVGLYVNDPAAWMKLSSATRSGLLAKLHEAERNFRVAGKAVFPSPRILTVTSVSTSTTSDFRLRTGDATLTAWSQSEPIPVTEDFGPTALGNQPFSFGTAVYRGYTSSDLFGWAPCASTNTGSSSGVVKICGGQALAEVSGAQKAGMTGAMVMVTGTAAAQADLPIIASYTNHSVHAEKVTVTGTVASVTMTMFASVLGAGCERSAMKYTTPGSGSLTPPLPDPPVIGLDDCLGNFHEQVLFPGALQLSAAMSTAQGVTTAIGDDLLTATNTGQLSSSPALQACATGRTLSDLAAVIKDFGGVGAPSCQPVALPKWTGTVAAGATIQFSIAPATQAISLGAGGEAAGLFTFADLHVSSQCSGTAACPAPAPAPCTSAALTNAIRAANVPLVLPENWVVQHYACQSGYALAGLGGIGYPVDAVFKQQGTSWAFSYVLGEFNSCSTEQNGSIIHSCAGGPSKALLQLLLNKIGTGPATTQAELYINTVFTPGALYPYPSGPPSIGIDNHDSITGLQWTAGRQGDLIGAGTLHYDNCNPNCAEGTPETFPVQITASNPQQCTVKLYPNGLGNPSQTVQAEVFSQINIQPLKGSPPSFLIDDPILTKPCAQSGG
jgi:hypothetical protein